MDIKYADIFSDEDGKKNLEFTNITSNKNNIQLLGKKSRRFSELSQSINNIIQKQKKKENKNKRKFNTSLDNKNENNNNIDNLTITKNNDDSSKKHVNDLYFLDNKIKINTNSKYHHDNSNKSKYQDFLGNKKSVLKIQEFIYDSHLTNTRINYKVITQIKTICFKTDNSLFQRGKQRKEINEDKYNLGQALIDAGSMPSMGFWNQRYYYFSKFDQGIQLDYESIL